MMLNKKYGLRKIFTNIYESGHWGIDLKRKLLSGGGSRPDLTTPWFEFLTKFMLNHNFSSMTDVGCGDFQNSFHWLSSFEKNHRKIEYCGVDIYRPLIEKLSSEHLAYRFECLDADQERNLLPSAEVIVLKDILQHWPNDLITDFIQWLQSKKRFKYLLLCNTSMQKRDWDDVDYPKRNGRGLTINLYPLKKFDFTLETKFDPNGRNRFKEISYLKL